MQNSEENEKYQIQAKRADYGIDAPNVIRNFALMGGTGVLIGAAGILVGALTLVMARGTMPAAVPFFLYSAPSIGLAALFFLATALVMLWGSKFGKMALRDKILNALTWRGDERVLDIGCGHGQMLLGAAKRLTTGIATGIDLWQNQDQANNSADAARENARPERVAERVDFVDGDARALPFADNTFDVVLSSWAIHNVYEAAGREKAVTEAARTLKPGGTITLTDIRHAPDYAQILRGLGWADVKTLGPNFLFVIPTFTVTARKPSPGKIMP